MKGSFGLLFISLRFTLCFAQTNNFGTENDVADYNQLPGIKWVYKTRKSIFSSPVVSENVVYFGGNDSIFYALAVESGRKLWNFKTSGEIRSGACINEDKLFLNGGDGFLYALDKSDGNLIWKYSTGGEKKYDFADYFHSTPVYHNGTIFFGSGDGYFHAINSVTGQKVWTFKTGNIIHSTPAMSDNKIFFGSFDGYVYALDILNGNLIWKFKTAGHRYFPAGEVQGSPALFNKLVFIGARDYNVYAIDQEQGYCHWNKALINGWGLNNSIHDSVLYTGTADERVLIASEPETGSEYWRKKMEFLVFGNCAFSENMIYVGTTMGKLHGISKITGEIVWSFVTESYIHNREKYFKEDDSYRDDIYSIILSNEHFLEVEIELGGIFTTPYISESIIILSSTNGMIYCLKRK